MKIEKADYVIVGSGLAGLRAAIQIASAGFSVALLMKDGPLDSSSEHAQGGIAAALSDEDEVGLHYVDTINAGDGLSNEEAVRVMVEEGPKYITELIEWGTEFDREGTRLAFTMEAAHSKRRILHAHGDATGREIVRALLKKASFFEKIKFYQRTFSIDLIIENGACIGLYFIEEGNSEIRSILTKGVLLATGGAGMVYRETTNPPQATGDGMAIAYLAGAEMMDMEFVQFHPTSLYLPDTPRFLLSESLRGEGAYLRNMEYKRFMEDYHPKKELAPRDVVSRSIIMELEKTKTSRIYLDISHLPASYLRDRFPRIFNTCLTYGIDISKDLIPVHPSAHYFMGGVKTDLCGRTSIRGLYAAGEVACTGVHGANRLASNSLLEGLVFGARAGETMLKDLKGKETPEGTSAKLHSLSFDEADAGSVFTNVRDCTWRKVGIIRNGERLKAAIEELDALGSQLRRTNMSRRGLEARNVLIVAKLIASAALKREESRGGHCRSDFPSRDDAHWKVHSIQRIDEPSYSTLKAQL
ncbi:MAG: L-aspartate oxidase [Acidobacteriota bacterium]